MSTVRCISIFFICLWFLCGCAVTEKEYAYLSYNELTLIVVTKSYFDPDGFSREYSGELSLKLENECEKSIRNDLSAVCLQEDGFSLPQLYANDCTNGQINFKNQNKDIEVSFEGASYPCKHFSKVYPFSIND